MRHSLKKRQSPRKQSLQEIRTARAGMTLPAWAIVSSERKLQRVIDAQKMAACWSDQSIRYRLASKTPANVSMSNWCAQNAAEIARTARVFMGVEAAAKLFKTYRED